MRAYLFNVPGDDMLYALTYGGETRVWHTALCDVSPVEGSLLLENSTPANGNEEAWGRLILERRQGGTALVLPRFEPGITIAISGDLLP